MLELIGYYNGQPITKDRLLKPSTIGSDFDNDIILPGNDVFPFHAKIEFDKNRLILVARDGPIYVNGTGIVGSSVLEESDFFELGQFKFQVVKSTTSISDTITASIHEDTEIDQHEIPLINITSPFKRQFRRARLLIGRTDDNDIVLNDPGVSKKHAEIYVDQGAYYLRDLESKNGTFLNDIRATNIPMTGTGNVRFGHTNITYKIEEQSRSDSQEIKGEVVEMSKSLGSFMIVGQSKALRATLEKAKLAAPTTDSVLLLGETGVGKELFAKLLHYKNPKRVRGPFVPVNCASIPEPLADSQLFGHARGAFTGAINDHRGFFEQANGGTLFLDEIGDLSPAVQTKLLRVFEDGLITPVGSNRTISVDVRIIGATNKELSPDVFRKDLKNRFDRRITIPSLAERADDIPMLIDYFARIHSPQPDIKFSHAVIKYLSEAQWEGNIRQLNKAIRLVISNAIIKNEKIIKVGDFDDMWLNISHKPYDSINDQKKLFLKEAWEKHDGIIARVAKELDVTRPTVYKWAKEKNLL